jgi:hypothetical protein
MGISTIAKPLEKLLLDRLKTPIDEALIVFDGDRRSASRLERNL